MRILKDIHQLAWGPVLGGIAAGAAVAAVAAATLPERVDSYAPALGVALALLAPLCAPQLHPLDWFVPRIVDRRRQALAFTAGIVTYVASLPFIAPTSALGAALMVVYASWLALGSQLVALVAVQPNTNDVNRRPY